MLSLSMDFLDVKLQNYAEEHSSPEFDYLKDLNRETHLKIMSPRMLSGHLQGRVLSMISKLIKPSYILEIGTYTGYSALCLAEGLNNNGKLITLDRNEELFPIVNKYVNLAGMQDKIEFRIGNALDIIPHLPNEIDLVFIDADKPNYLAYYELVLPKMKNGGVILADNVLWSGKVIEHPPAKDKSTQALLEFNDFVKNDQRTEKVLLPIRDGITIIRKL